MNATTFVPATIALGLTFVFSTPDASALSESPDKPAVVVAPPETNSVGHRGRSKRKHPRERFDANSDGTLDEAERQAARAAFIERHDANGDGTLDDDERPARMKRRRARRQHMMERFDANSDGTLDETERQAARDTMKKRRQSRSSNTDQGGTEADTGRRNPFGNRRRQRRSTSDSL